MEKIRVLCYGDSNTWGYISGSDHQRYGENERWTKLLGKSLGDNYEVIEEGLNSRTLTSDDPRPGKVGKNGYQYLIPCLDSHNPLDLVIIMLGTNELKNVYNKTAEDIGKTLEDLFVKTILNRKSKITGKNPKILIVTPPALNDNVDAGKYQDSYCGTAPKSRELDGIYKEIAKRNNCYFLSNEELETGIDGVHLTKESHEKLAKSLEKIIRGIFE